MSRDVQQRKAEMIKKHEEEADREIETERRRSKINSSSREKANKLVSRWIDEQFEGCDPQIELPIAEEKLEKLGLLLKGMPIDSVPWLKECQNQWVVDGDPPKYDIERMKNSMKLAVTTSKPSQIDVFARTMILMASGTRAPAPAVGRPTGQASLMTLDTIERLSKSPRRPAERKAMPRLRPRPPPKSYEQLEHPGMSERSRSILLQLDGAQKSFLDRDQAMDAARSQKKRDLEKLLYGPREKEKPADIEQVRAAVRAPVKQPLGWSKTVNRCRGAYQKKMMTARSSVKRRPFL
jgi:hypothetical protein